MSKLRPAPAAEEANLQMLCKNNVGVFYSEKDVLAARRLYCAVAAAIWAACTDWPPNLSPRW